MPRLLELQEWHDYVVAAPTACIASPNAREAEQNADCHQGNQRGQHNLISWQEITSTRKRTRRLLNLLPNETEDRTVSSVATCSSTLSREFGGVITCGLMGDFCDTRIECVRESTPSSSGAAPHPMVSHLDSQTAEQKGILSISHTKRQESRIFPESTFFGWYGELALRSRLNPHDPVVQRWGRGF